MSSRTNAAALTIGLALFVFPSFAQTGVITRSNSEIFLHLPPVGLAVSENAQVNVTNTAPPPANAPTAAPVPPAAKPPTTAPPAAPIPVRFSVFMC